MYCGKWEGWWHSISIDTISAMMSATLNCILPSMHTQNRNTAHFLQKRAKVAFRTLFVINR